MPKETIGRQGQTEHTPRRSLSLDAGYTANGKATIGSIPIGLEQPDSRKSSFDAIELDNRHTLGAARCERPAF